MGGASLTEEQIEPGTIGADNRFRLSVSRETNIIGKEGHGWGAGPDVSDRDR